MSLTVERSVKRFPLKIHGVVVEGLELDSATRCAHYHSHEDVVAIRFYCCNRWFACFSCHQKLCTHPAEVWPKQSFSECAILCGMCGTKLSIDAYMICEDHCPVCNTAFNPGCRLHHHLYFSVST